LLTAKHTQQGFTLVELLIAVAILGILVAMAIPSYREFIENSRIRNVAESLQNGLQAARAEAVKRNAQVQFVWGAGSSWTVGCVTVTANCPATLQSRTTGEGSSATVTLTSIPAGGTTVIFNNFGAVVASATTPTQFDVDTTGLDAADSRELRVTIGTGGNSRMCDPNLVLADDPRGCPP
jgi:type IV fimbrial biogenesis protein FimT